MDKVALEKRRELYTQIVSNTPGVELKGKNMLYTSDNGHMFSQINKDGEIGIRLSKEDGQNFIKKQPGERTF